MTSKRLGIFIIALAAVWSLAGLDWSASPSCDTPHPVLSVSAAEAGGFTGLHSFGTRAVEGDPDEYGNSPDGDPDEYGDSPSDSTATNSGESTENRSPSLLEGIISILGGWFRGLF